MRLTAAVLAGGRSTRMGRDKARLPVSSHGSLLERQIAVLQQALHPVEVLVSCRPTQRLSLPRGVVAVFDEGNAGPLGGLVEVLRVARAEAVFVLGVDLGRILAATVRRIAARAEPARGAGVVPLLDGPEPLAAVWPRTLLGAAERRLAAGQDLSLRGLVREGFAAGRLRPWAVADSERSQFANWNRPVDVRWGA